MNKKIIILILVLLFVVGGGLLFVYVQHRDIKQNPEDTIGNTAGNLNNGGTFCETEDAIYFANPYDENTLYKMNPDLTKIKKLSGAAIGFINCAGDYLYYYQKNSSAASSLGFVVHVSGIYRSDLEGKHVLCLDKSDTDSMVLYGNRVYYTKAVDGKLSLCLHSISTSKKDPKMLTDFLLNPASVNNGQIYYNGNERDHYLYTFDIRSETSSLVAQYNMWFPVYYGGSVYFLDVDHNYRLCRLDMMDGNLTVITNDRVDCFNVSGGYIYYQTNQAAEDGLYRAGIDGSDPVLVSKGIFRNINIAGGYVFFQAFQTDIPQYMCPVGSTSVSTFDAAKAEAMKNL